MIIVGRKKKYYLKIEAFSHHIVACGLRTVQLFLVRLEGGSVSLLLLFLLEEGRLDMS